MSDRQRIIKSIAVFALPVVLTKAAAVFLVGTGAAEVAAVEAAPIDFSAMPRLDAGREWTPVQKAASAHIVFLRTQPLGLTPLLHGEAKPVVDSFPVTTGSDAPQAALQVILDAGPDSVAYFDGKRHKVGDALHGSKWILAEINGAERSVTVQHRDTGQKSTYFVRAPGSR